MCVCVSVLSWAQTVTLVGCVSGNLLCSIRFFVLNFKREIFYLLLISWCVDALYKMYKDVIVTFRVLVYIVTWVIPYKKAESKVTFVSDTYVHNSWLLLVSRTEGLPKQLSSWEHYLLLVMGCNHKGSTEGRLKLSILRNIVNKSLKGWF